MIMKRTVVLLLSISAVRIEAFSVRPSFTLSLSSGRIRLRHPHDCSLVPRSSSTRRLLANPINSDDDDDAVSVSELIVDNDDNDDTFGLGDTPDDWIPDRVKAKTKRLAKRIRVERVLDEQAKTQQQAKESGSSVAQPPIDSEDDPQLLQQPRPSPYNDEQERLIASMGGKKPSTNNVREPGYLGDCTLEEIATDYSVPVCYLADVLCMWGVPVPIDTKSTRLGDMVTGEQAFAILEAVTSLDIAALQDRYANENLINLCANWELDLQEAFGFCVKEGWSLPFGVRTCLRVEQVDELLRVMQKI